MNKTWRRPDKIRPKNVTNKYLSLGRSGNPRNCSNVMSGKALVKMDVCQAEGGTLAVTPQVVFVPIHGLFCIGSKELCREGGYIDSGNVADITCVKGLLLWARVKKAFVCLILLVFQIAS